MAHSFFDFNVDVSGTAVTLKVNKISDEFRSWVSNKTLTSPKVKFLDCTGSSVSTVIFRRDFRMRLGCSSTRDTEYCDSAAEAKTFAAKLTKALELISAKYEKENSKTPTQSADIKDHFTYELNLDTKAKTITLEISKQSTEFTLWAKSSKSGDMIGSVNTVELRHRGSDTKLQKLYVKGDMPTNKKHIITICDTKTLLSVFNHTSEILETAVKAFVKQNTVPVKKKCPYVFVSDIKKCEGKVVLSLHDGEKCAVFKANDAYYTVKVPGSTAAVNAGIWSHRNHIDSNCVILGDVGSVGDSITRASLISEDKIPANSSEVSKWEFKK